MNSTFLDAGKFICAGRRCDWKRRERDRSTPRATVLKPFKNLGKAFAAVVVVRPCEWEFPSGIFWLMLPQGTPYRPPGSSAEQGGCASQRGDLGWGPGPDSIPCLAPIRWDLVRCAASCGNSWQTGATIAPPEVLHCLRGIPPSFPWYLAGTLARIENPPYSRPRIKPRLFDNRTLSGGPVRRR